jgi:hypothetical protein
VNRVCSKVNNDSCLVIHLWSNVMLGFRNKSMKRSGFLRASFACLVAIAAAGLVSVRADEIHTGDIELEIDGNKLVTHNGRYFESAFTLTSGVYRSTAPGFDSAAGLLEPGEEIGFNVVGPLLYWDGDELVAPQTGLALNMFWGLDSVAVTGASGVPGFSLGGATSLDGSFHEHFTFEIAAAANVGAYGVLLELTPEGSSTFTASDPFLLVFNRGLGAAEFESGVDAMVNVTAVPEPSSIALAGLGVAGIARAALRRRMRKQ